MKIDRKGLELCIAEADGLSNTKDITPQQKRRYAFLLSAISVLKAGQASLRELELENLNETARRNGLPLTNLNDGKVPSFLSSEQQVEARGWKSVVERRDMTEGAPMINHIGTYTGLSFFVPNDFFPQVFATMKAHDVLFDEDSVTFIKSTNGRPLPVPVAGDVENVASVIGEAGSQTTVDIASTNHAVLGAYSYATHRYVASLEAFEDLEGTLSVVELFKKFSADQLARGIGADLVNGSGVGKPLGLLGALTAAGISPIIASGSSSNTGGSETGQTTLGSNDFAAAVKALDDAYLSSSKCAWLMNRRTLMVIASVISKQGLQMDLVKWDGDGKAFIYGLPVKICPSLPDIAASSTPVVLGDLTYWATRLIVGDDAGIRVYTEAPGLIEKGDIGLKTFVRADGHLLYTDTGSPAPFTFIQQHS